MRSRHHGLRISRSNLLCVMYLWSASMSVMPCRLSRRSSTQGLRSAYSPLSNDILSYSSVVLYCAPQSPRSRECVILFSIRSEDRVRHIQLSWGFLVVPLHCPPHRCRLPTIRHSSYLFAHTRSERAGRLVLGYVLSRVCLSRSRGSRSAVFLSFAPVLSSLLYFWLRH